MKVIEYKVIKIKDADSLLAKGWQPFGSPFLTNFDNEAWTSQAMVKYETPPSPSTYRYRGKLPQGDNFPSSQDPEEEEIEYLVAQYKKDPRRFLPLLSKPTAKDSPYNAKEGKHLNPNGDIRNGERS